MKPGKEYELFTYEKFKRLFADAKVKHDDHITGNESGLERQIDVSIRIPIGDGQELLYIVQCKDWAEPSDINVIGELVAVMQDVGAAKGFLLCTSGFAKTNHQYALTKGVELITVEDIESEKWSTEVEIPLIYTQKDYHWRIDLGVDATEELVEANKDTELQVVITNHTLLRAADREPTHMEDYIQGAIEDPGFNGLSGERVDLQQAGLEIQLVGMWLPVSELVVEVDVKPRRYLKYLQPDEYSQLRDHVRDEILPLHAKLTNVPMTVDGTFIELADGEVPVTPGLWLDFETWTQVEMNAGLGPQN
jgi:hypothetical protein